jgi:hypothetical protein
MSRFEREILTSDENVQALADLGGRWISEANRRTKTKKLIPEMDSSESQSHAGRDWSS